MSAVPKPQPEQAVSLTGPVTGRRGDQKRSGSTRLLGDELRRMRQERGLGLKDVAPVIRGSVSKVSRLERGESPPKERDVWDLVHFYRVPAERLHMIEELLRQTRSEEWWQQYTDVTPAFLRRLISLEGQAEKIYTYETHVVPGLLQTPAYTRVLISAALHGASEEAIERRVRFRQSRRAAFSAGRPRVVALLEEAVLRRLVGSPEVMREQLQYLVDIGRQGGVNIRVIPFLKGADAVPLSSVTHLYFDDGGPPSWSTWSTSTAPSI
ncbi:helix-turn-helix domain-containing protein [Streptomyces sp. CA-181903]|uniref:helix-turn-helix domain-containing protein n=1 Tax=Streptomyces sp. CA-181903 TaxID=3240055 RepID=UPI003D8A1D9C